jgi:protein involved in polysaccharide export with SLBB domain
MGQDSAAGEWNLEYYRMRRVLVLFILTLVALTAFAQNDIPELKSRPQESPAEQQKISLPRIENREEQQPQNRREMERSPQEKTETQEERSRTRARSERPLNQFQRFVLEDIGSPLPIFGQELFDSVPTTFAPLNNVPVTADYVLGAGDEVIVRAWGQVDIDYHAKIDRAGDLYVPKVGTLHIAGLRYDQLQSYLRSAISRIYQNFDLSVGLGELRSIQVFVVGQAERPGSYTISSLSTLVNAIFAAGGPTPNGSMRHIVLRRENKSVVDFDLYDLVLNGDKSKDVRLLPGDVIYFSPVGPLAAITGSVHVPAIYELRQETSFGDLISLAGSLSSVARGDVASVERIENRSKRKVEEFPLDEQGLGRQVRDGDIIRIRPVSARFENAVTLRGNVALPGRYPWHQGLRVKDLLPDLASLIAEKYWVSQNEITRSAQQGGEISLQQGESAQQTTVRSAGRESGLALEIQRTSPDINWEYALIERLDEKSLTTRLIPFNLRNALLQPDSEDNLALQPGDVVTVFSQRDLRAPIASQPKYVFLEGEFAAPGVYKTLPGETLKQLVERVGGFSPNAYLYGATFSRLAAQQEQQKQLDEALDRFERNIHKNASLRANEQLNLDEKASSTAAFESQMRLVQKLRQMRADGRVVLPLTPKAAGPENLPDLVLEDGDRLVVPSVPEFVNVIGSVQNTSSLIYRSGLEVRDYLHEAGGVTSLADAKQMYVIRANGSILGRHGSSLFGTNLERTKLMPGDSIVIPEKLEKGATIRNLKDWSTILGQIGLAASVVNLLR